MLSSTENSTALRSFSVSTPNLHASGHVILTPQVVLLITGGGGAVLDSSIFHEPLLYYSVRTRFCCALTSSVKAHVHVAKQRSVICLYAELASRRL